MCLGVYLGSDSKLELVAFHEWSPAFNVAALEPWEASVRGILRRQYVYSLGAHTECGCGFEPEAEGETERIAESREALSRYVGVAREAGEVELYVCWDGDAGDEPAQRLRLNANELMSFDHWLIMGTLTRVLAASESGRESNGF